MRDQLRYNKKKAIVNLINIFRISKYVDRSSTMKLLHGLIFSNIDFCNSIYYDLPNCDLRPLQITINSATRVIMGKARFCRERITPISIDLHFFLP